jgi:hypothetical protein
VPGNASPLPSLPMFNPDYYANSVDALKRRTEDMKRTLPNQIEVYTKAIDEIDKEKVALGSLLVGTDTTADQKQISKDRLDKLEISRQPQFAALNRMQAQLRALDSITQTLSDLGEREKTLGDRKIEQAALQKLAVDAESLLDRLDERAQGILSNDNALNIFTMISTISFAALVGCIIVLFFIIAFKDASVRNAIFAGESGIQFITLFSLVIAIILFGVLRILEGKELAALLGGLSGYILGRGSNTSPGTRTLPPAPAPVPAPEPAH